MLSWGMFLRRKLSNNQLSVIKLRFREKLDISLLEVKYVVKESEKDLGAKTTPSSSLRSKVQKVLF